MNWTVFQGDKRIVSGPPTEVMTALKARAYDQVLVFDDETGKPVDLDLRGSLSECLARLPPNQPAAETARGPGRPRLGVVPREVTLLPRHWEWLSAQPGGASVALRRLVDAARAAGGPEDDRRRAREVVDRVMRVLAGDRPGYEEATRALYAGQSQRFRELTEPWPGDIRDHIRHLARDAFGEKSDGG